MSKFKDIRNKNEETYHGDDFYIQYGEMYYNDDSIVEAEYQGREVKLGKLNFGDPNMTIKKHIPARRKSFRARHNCDDPGPRTMARYWSCKKW